MAKPSFLVIGAAKCGTTSLCSLLSRHPDVFVHPEKELNFFCFDDLYDRGFAWYASLFEGTADRTAVGEGSPNYTKRTKHPHSAERIAKHLPEARLLYIVRHPLRRMESAWLHARRAGHRSYASLSKTVRRFPTYVDASDYGRQLDAYREFFPEEQIRVLFLDDLERAPAAILEETFRFLGVDPGAPLDGPELALNVSDGTRIDGPLLHELKRIPALRRLDKRAPRAWRRFRKRHLQTEVAGRPDWDEDTRRWLIDRLAEPTAHFLAACGKPAGTWDLTA